jgi:uncharacterized protein
MSTSPIKPSLRPIAETSNGSGKNPQKRTTPAEKKIWIDLDNSPHVPFFKPIIEKLKFQGYSVVVTARDCFQVCELADLLNVNYQCIGHHYGKHRLAKLAGLGIRVLQMTPFVLREKPDLAVSHGSRTQTLLSWIFRIPTVVIMDYEHTSFLSSAWIMAPEIVPDKAAAAKTINKHRILKYPGIKEDVYVRSFRPDPAIRARIGLSGDELVITLRPPATEAHYHNPESEELLSAVFDLIGQTPNVKTFLLPRTKKQEGKLRRRWPDLFQEEKVVVPEVVNGLDLIWVSDLVISGGGTMNREAAALGVPVYSIFRGKIGAVDQYLADTGRLTLLQTANDVRTKVAVVHREREPRTQIGTRSALEAVVENIVSVVESRRMAA